MRNIKFRLIYPGIYLICLTLLASCGGRSGLGTRSSGSSDFIDPTPTITSTPSSTTSASTPASTLTPTITPTPNLTPTPINNADWVKNVEASVLTYNDRIRISWAARPEDGVSYNIYRFKSGVLDFSTTIHSNFYEDNQTNSRTPPIIDTLYRYRITWSRNGIEFGKEAPLTIGIFSTTTDLFENNDIYAQAQLVSVGTYIVHTFGFDDGVGSSFGDNDWYYCRNASDTMAMKVSVKLINTSKDLRVKCYQGSQGQELDSTGILYIVAPKTSIYFKVEPVSGEGFGTYQIKVEND